MFWGLLPLLFVCLNLLRKLEKGLAGLGVVPETWFYYRYIYIERERYIDYRYKRERGGSGQVVYYVNCIVAWISVSPKWLLLLLVKNKSNLSYFNAVLYLFLSCSRAPCPHIHKVNLLTVYDYMSLYLQGQGCLKAGSTHHKYCLINYSSGVDCPTDEDDTETYPTETCSLSSLGFNLQSCVSLRR